MESVQESPPVVSVSADQSSQLLKKSKKEKLKSFLLTFFLIEHFVILLVLLVPAVFFIRAYAYSGFGQLNEKASNFTPKDKDEVFNKYMEKYKGYLVTFVASNEDKPVFTFELEESDVNSQLSTLKLDKIEKIYISFDDDNVTYLWIKPTPIPYPIMAKLKYVYDYKSEIFEVQILDWQIGPLSFPASVLGFVENAVNKDAWTGISNIFKNSSAHIVSINSSKENLKISFQVDDKEAFMKSFVENIGSNTNTPK